MILAPDRSIPAAASLILRVAALLAITVLIGDFSQIVPVLGKIYSDPLNGAGSVFSIPDIAAFILALAACVLVLILAPALVAWSQLGAARANGPDAGWDRACRAMILTAALLLVMAGVYEDARGALLAHYGEITPMGVIWIWMSSARSTPLIAFLVILFSPALGVGLNAVQRVLQARAEAPA